MQHLNYCRQAMTAFVDGEVAVIRVDNVSQMRADTDAANAFEFLKKSIKFSLPPDGRTMNDLELRALGGQRIELPYSCVALEYYATQKDTPLEHSFSKRIVLAVNALALQEKDQSGLIAVCSICFSDFIKKWIFAPPVFIPKEGYLYFENNIPKLYIIPSVEVPIDDYSDEVFALLDFLNALACRNVHVEKSPAKGTKQGKKVKTALPFDDYHFLTVDVPGKAGVRGEGLGGSHRSPREHLRRGHIRRLDSGPIWVNACVVNAGIGSKVGKSYLLRKSE